MTVNHDGVMTKDDTSDRIPRPGGQNGKGFNMRLR